MKNKVHSYYFKIFLFLIFLNIQCSQVKIPLESDLLGILGIQWNDSYQYPKVTNITPADGSNNVSKESQIIIDFSKDMDTKKVESAIQVISPGGNTDYRPSWVFKKRLVLNFPNSLSVGKRYEVTINSSTARDSEDNKLSKNFLSTFVTEGVESLPEVLTSDPPKGSEIFYGWPTSRNLTLIFSEPMDAISTNGAISISGGPAVYLPIWNSNFSQLTLQLRSPLELGRTYTLRVSTAAKSSKGITLKSDYFTVFSTSQNLTIPEVSIDITSGTPWTNIIEEPFLNSFTGVSKFDVFRFVFSEAMNVTNINGEISFSPSIAGNFQWLSSNQLIFTPSQGMVTNQVYRMSFRPDFTSSSGIKMNKSYTIDFRVNDPFTSENIGLNSISGWNYSIACLINPVPEINIPTPIDTNIAYEIRPRACPIEYDFEISFNTAGSSALVANGPGSIYENINLEYISGSSSTNIRIEQIDYIPSANPQRVRVKVRGISPNGARYLLTINGGDSGMRDSNGNKLLSNENLLFYGNFL